MNNDERKDYNKIYYLKNKEKINERKRVRYESDSDYRDKVRRSALDRFRKGRKNSVPKIKKLKEFNRNPFKRRGVKYAKINGELVVLRNSSELAKSIGVTSNTVKNWHKADILPEPLFIDSYGCYWYDNDYIESVRKAIMIRDSRSLKGRDDLKRVIREAFNG